MGTWAVPNTRAKALQVAKLFSRPLRAADVGDRGDKLYHLVGDDGLCDVLHDFPANYDVRPVLADLLREWDESYQERPDDWKDRFAPGAWATLRRAYGPFVTKRSRRSFMRASHYLKRKPRKVVRRRRHRKAI